MLVFVPVVAAALVFTWAVTYLVGRAGARLRMLDLPNERSLHSRPVPRSGGLAMWAGVVVAVMLALALLGPGGGELVWIVPAALMVGVVSFIDDRSQVP